MMTQIRLVHVQLTPRLGNLPFLRCCQQSYACPSPLKDKARCRELFLAGRILFVACDIDIRASSRSLQQALPPSLAG
jgi:hypothetical protein